MRQFIVFGGIIFALVFCSLWTWVGGKTQVDRTGISDKEFYFESYYGGIFLDDLDPAVKDTHFNGVSKSLSDLDFGDPPEAMSPEDTLNLLGAAARPLAGANTSEESVERIRFLLVKSLPDERGKKLANLFPGYLCYSRQKETLDKRFADQKNDLSSQRQHYTEQIVVREACMGKTVSDRLFQREDKLTWYLFDRREIMSNDRLTAGQKKGMLDQLMNEFSQTVAQETGREY